MFIVLCRVQVKFRSWWQAGLFGCLHQIDEEQVAGVPILENLQMFWPTGLSLEQKHALGSQKLCHEPPPRGGSAVAPPPVSGWCDVGGPGVSGGKWSWCEDRTWAVISLPVWLQIGMALLGSAENCKTPFLCLRISQVSEICLNVFFISSFPNISRPCCCSSREMEQHFNLGWEMGEKGRKKNLASLTALPFISAENLPPNACVPRRSACGEGNTFICRCKSLLLPKPCSLLVSLPGREPCFPHQPLPTGFSAVLLFQVWEQPAVAPHKCPVAPTGCVGCCSVCLQLPWGFSQCSLQMEFCKPNPNLFIFSWVLFPKCHVLLL